MDDDSTCGSDVITAKMIDETKKQACDEAFEHVKKRLTSTTALESLSQFRQIAAQRYQNKQAFLKARVQKGVGDIETGIKNLSTTADSMQELLTAIHLIEDECSSVKDSIPEFEQLTKIAVLYENLVTIRDLVQKLDYADQVIDALNEFLQKEPFSVHCYNYCHFLLNFEEEIHSRVSSTELNEFVSARFASVHENLKTIVGNSRKLIESAFSEEEPNTNLISRAIWILYAEGNTAKDITNMLETAIFNDFNDVLSGASEKDIASKLDILSEKIQLLPDQLELIIPALPKNEIDPVKLINEKVNKFLHIVLTHLWGTNNTSSYLAKNILVWLRNTSRSMRRTIGIDPSEELQTLSDQIEKEFVGLMTQEFMAISSNILSRDDLDVETESSNSTLRTPAPEDLMRAMIDGFQIAKQAGLPELIPKVASTLISGLVQRLREYADKVSYTSNLEYAIAVVNNCMRGVTATRDVKASEPSLMTPERMEEVKRIWSQIQTSAISQIQNLVNQEMMNGSTNLREDFSNKIDALDSILSRIQELLIGPLYTKIEKTFVNNIIPRYMMSFQQRIDTDPKDEEEFHEMLERDRDTIIYRFINPRVRESDQKSYLSRLNDFVELMTADENSIIFNYSALFQVYPDFVPSFACKLIANRAKSVPKMVDKFEQVIQSANHEVVVRYFDVGDPSDPDQGSKPKLFSAFAAKAKAKTMG